MPQQLSTNTFTTAKWIVSANAYDGTHTTIGAALTSASSGDTIFIRPGTYTENPTLKAGVNLTAFVCDAFTPNVIISGTCTLSTVGTVTISGIELQTNSSFALTVSGSVASVVNLIDCRLNCSNNTGISLTSSSASSQIAMYLCTGNLGTTGIAYFAHSGAGNITILYCNSLANSGASTTQNTISGAGSFNLDNSFLASPVSYSSTSLGSINWSAIDTSALNVTPLTINISGAITSDYSKFVSGSATPIVVTAGLLAIRNADLESSASTNVSGAGGLNYSNLTFTNTNHGMTVTTPFAYTGTSTSWVFISTKTASSSATISFTDMVSKGAFPAYALVLQNVVPATNNTSFSAQVSSNGGSSYLNSGYATVSSSQSTLGISATTSTTSWLLVQADVANTAALGLSGTVYMYNVNSGVTPSFNGTLAYSSVSAGHTDTATTGGFGPATTTVNAIQLLFSSGNISTGTFSLFGINL